MSAHAMSRDAEKWSDDWATLNAFHTFSDNVTGHDVQLLTRSRD